MFIIFSVVAEIEIIRRVGKKNVESGVRWQIRLVKDSCTENQLQESKGRAGEAESTKFKKNQAKKKKKKYGNWQTNKQANKHISKNSNTTLITYPLYFLYVFGYWPGKQRCN